MGAPDAVIAVILPALLTELRRDAPGIDLGVRNLVGRFEAAMDGGLTWLLGLLERSAKASFR